MRVLLLGFYIIHLFSVFFFFFFGMAYSSIIRRVPFSSSSYISIEEQGIMHMLARRVIFMMGHAGKGVVILAIRHILFGRIHTQMKTAWFFKSTQNSPAIGGVSNIITC
jgi:hypothetical protein